MTCITNVFILSPSDIGVPFGNIPLDFGADYQTLMRPSDFHVTIGL